MRAFNIATKIALLLLVLAAPLAAQEMKDKKMQDDKMMKDDKMMMAEAKPRVAVIRADWCPACQKLGPTMKELMAEYGDKLEFIIFDVTSEQTSSESAARAAKLGLTKFFNENKGKTSTIAVIDAKGKVTFKTSKNFDREAYVRAFDKAIAMK